MYQIALCDDEQTELMKTKEMLSSYKKLHPELDFEIGTFENAEKLLVKVQEGYAPDLILMDIYMDGKSGIEAARELREMGKKSRVVFLTTSENHALEAFRLDAVQYLLKPVSEADLFSLLDKQIEVLDYEKQKYVALQIDNKIIRVMVHDIVYCEAQGKRQYLHMTDGTQLCVHMSMTGLEELFTPYEEIVRIGKWYIINMDHVEGLDSQAVQMDNEQQLYLPRGAYQTLRKHYIAYYTGALS
ncbi:MAG: response regulator transcription factor [Lachnospiraceae bacterium]|nr:response regulator transcription factor [Lachnospiraceae bacterium]